MKYWDWPVPHRLQVSATAASLALWVARVNWNRCKRALEQAKAGHGQIVGVMGEPGLGKSRYFMNSNSSSQRVFAVGSFLGFSWQSLSLPAGH